MKRLALALMIALGGMAALAPGAFAAAIAVDTTADNTTDDTSCTLREAIASANANNDPTDDCVDGVGADVITFGPVFVGQPLNSTINVLGTTNGPLPAVTDDLTITGGSCGAADPPKPCVGIDVTQTNDDALTVSGGADLTVEGLSIIGAGTAINGTGAGAFSVQHSWFGINLMQVGGANANNIGIHPGNGAVIGGDTPIERNLIANNGQAGIHILGGDSNTITGNYFSTNLTGTVNANTNNGTNIEIGDNNLDQATGNVIGGADAGTPTVCDGLCNLLGHTGSGAGISLFVIGESSPTGPTTIKGNFIGLSVNGDTGLGNAAEGILSPAATQVTIGGNTAAEGNYIADNIGFGVNSSSPGLSVKRNFFGLNAAATATLPNNTGGSPGEILLNTANAATVTNNRFGQGSLNLFTNSSTFQGNVVGIGTGGEDLGGTSTSVSIIGDGNTIGGSGAGEGNAIGNAKTVINAGVLDVSGDGNTIRGNLIGVDSAGNPQPNAGVGIRIGPSDSNNNIVGGIGAGEGNVVSNSSFDAIQLASGGGLNSGNTFRGNTGRDNGPGISTQNQFLDIGDEGIDNTGDVNPPAPNAGIEAADIDEPNSNATHIEGTDAEPLATIDVYQTFTNRGNVRAYLATGAALGDGTWSVPYGTTLPAGACVTVAQTDSIDGTSEMPVPFTVGGGACDVTGPTTSIDSGPSGLTNDATPTFGFSADEPSTFECKIDAGSFSACATGFTPTVGQGAHTLQVRSTDLLDNAGSTASRSFSVDSLAPNTIGSFVKKARKRMITASFSSSEPGSTFRCKLDAGAFAPCTSPKTYRKLKRGKRHTVQVESIDVAGNVDASPVTASIKVPRKRHHRH